MAAGTGTRRVLVVLGTRPEAIKLAPVVAALLADARFCVRIVTTGQHRTMVRQALEPFGLTADDDLEICRPNQTLSEITCRAVERLDGVLTSWNPDLVLVQGDTTSAFAAALAAFHRRIAVGHVEAGLRSADRAHPFPEEVNRRLIAPLADLHFAPTARCGRALVAEGIDPDAVFVCGNTVVDALLRVAAKHRDEAPAAGAPPQVLVTLHRRESWDPAGSASEGFARSPLGAIARGVARAAAEHPGARFLIPMHRNPRVREIVRAECGGLANIRLTEPMPYDQFVVEMMRSRLVLTDSGGIQEEAPSLGLRVLLAREVTERPEGIEAGTTVLVGRAEESILAALRVALAELSHRPVDLPCPNPFGDGEAARRIRQAILHYWGEAARPGEFTLDPELAAAFSLRRPAEPAVEVNPK